LGGIYTALKSSRAEAVLFLACDMPFLTAALMRRLLRSFRAGDAASFATLRRRVGFPFVIHTRCGPLVKKEILLGRLSLQQLAVALKARRMSISLSQSAALFNINTPEDLAAALRQAQDEARRGRKR
jgi:molybdopterin-guanine dinucleotide biosynthesis protein A